MNGKIVTGIFGSIVRFSAAVLCLLCLGVIVLGAVGTAARYGYIVDAAKAISEIYYRAGEITDSDRETVAAVACTALSTLAADPNFRKDLDGVLARRSGRQSEIMRLREDFQEFLTKFLALEHDQMLREGFDRRLVDTILSRVEFGRYSKSSEPFSAEELVSQVRNLGDATCKLSEAIKQGNKNRAITDAALRVTVQGFGGAAVLVLDVSEMIVTEGLGAVVALLSEEIGREMVRNAAEELKRLLSLIM